MGVFLWSGDQALNSPLSGWWQITETTSGEPLRLQLAGGSNIERHRNNQADPDGHIHHG